MDKRRRKSYHRGKWMLQRERCRIADYAPGAGMQPARRIGDVIPQIMKRMKIPSMEWMDELVATWPEIVGKNIAAHARPGRSDNAVLIVFVDNSVWLNELERYNKTSLLAKLQDRFGKRRISKLVFRLDPDAGKAT